MMGPDDLDKLILHSLQKRGRQSLPELSTDTGANAKDILRRLHVLTGARRLLTGLSDGMVMYWLSGAPERDELQSELQRLEAKRERATTVPAVHAEEPPCVPLRDEHDAIRTQEPEPKFEPVAVRKPQQRKPIKRVVVREEVRITELYVQRVSDCLIIEEMNEQVGGRENDAVTIPLADVPKLIEAMQLLLEANP